MSRCERLGRGAQVPRWGRREGGVLAVPVLGAADGADLPVLLLSHRLLAAVPHRLGSCLCPQSRWLGGG